MGRVALYGLVHGPPRPCITVHGTNGYQRTTLFSIEYRPCTGPSTGPQALLAHMLPVYTPSHYVLSRVLTLFASRRGLEASSVHSEARSPEQGLQAVLQSGNRK